MPSVPSMPAPAPTLPTGILQVGESEIFTLYYRQGMNPHPMQKNFRFPGEFKYAIERGKNHCENMGLRFISVRPFIINLENEEKRNQE